MAGGAPWQRVSPPKALHPFSCLRSLFGGSDYKLIYRHYATLYFVFCVDSSESELGILDLIQVGLSAAAFAAPRWPVGAFPRSTVRVGGPGPHSVPVHFVSVASLCQTFWRWLKLFGGCHGQGMLQRVSRYAAPPPGSTRGGQSK